MGLRPEGQEAKRKGKSSPRGWDRTGKAAGTWTPVGVQWGRGESREMRCKRAAGPHGVFEENSEGRHPGVFRGRRDILVAFLRL